MISQSTLPATIGKPSSLLLEMARRSRALQLQGESIISLVMGEPDADTPELVKEAAIAALRRGETRYTAPEGTPALISAIQRKFSRDYGVDFDREQIIASNGALHVISLAFQATLQPGQEVILPSPYWSSYIDVIRVFGGQHVSVPCSHGDDGVDIVALAQAITPKTSWVVLNFPSNPSGAVA